MCRSGDDYPQLSCLLATHAQRAKFLEQAFDWDLMSQAFYPYYWSNRCNWKNLFQSQDSIDGIFQAFLQSGMARIVAPIRPGFEDAVLYFQETGEVWNGTGIALPSVRTRILAAFSLLDSNDEMIPIHIKSVSNKLCLADFKYLIISH